VSVRALAAALLLGAGLAGCGAGPLDLGVDSDFLWWTDHETGDLQDWLRGAPDLGASYMSGGGQVAVQPGLARSGSHALVSTAPAAGGATSTSMSAGQVTRTGSLPASAYYGAWFYLPSFARPATYWVFFSFHAGASTPLWDLKLAAADDGTLSLQLLHHDTGDVAALRTVPVPLGRWFQVQAFYRTAGDTADALRIYQDGDLIFDVEGQESVPVVDLGWTLGTLTDGLTPGPTSLYVDDAFISKREIDAQAPPFWRGP
jgi:hypothetical protein